jgi:hypothetical protein
MFDIYLTDEIVPESEGYAVYSNIRLGNSTETFVTSLVNWTREQYEQQWIKACRRMIGGSSQSALIASYVEPSMSEFLVWWPLYREGGIVHVQNCLLIYSELSNPFTIDDPWPFVQERQVLTGDGLEVSEWDIQIQDIREFLDRRG